MKRVFCLFFILFTLGSGALKAQQEKWEVQGVVLDSLTLEPEMYATIRIFRQPDLEKPVVSFVSDNQGLFQSWLSVAGSYKLLITSVGRETIVKNFEISKEKPVCNLGNLLIREDIKHLAGVSIFAAKPLVKAEVDKTSYSVEDDPDSETNTLLEMLRKVPLVTVDGEDNIKINGSSSFKIYMNGKPTNMLSNNPKEALRSIPASTIKKIEVISDPGARYDAEGVSGVLNIITKSAEFEGYNANLNAMAMSTVRMAGGFATLKYGKLSFSANYSFSDYRYRMKSDYSRRQFNSPEEAGLNRQSDLNVKTPGHYGALEASYEIDSLNLVSVSGSLNYYTNRSSSYESYTMNDSECNPVYFYNQSSREREKWGNNSLKADYQHLFKRNPNEVLTLSYQYDHSPNDVDREFRISDKQGESPSLQYLNDYTLQLNEAKGHEHTLQLDYVNALSQQHSIEGGVKYILRNNVSDASTSRKTTEQEEWTPTDFQPLVTYNHVQNILAAYAGYTFSRKRWGLTGGLRMEHTWQNVKYKQGNGADFNYQATNWIPSFVSSFKLNDRQQLRLAYNMRLRRPGIGFLNPYVLISGTNIRYGNPGLTPEKHNRITFSYSYFSTKVNIQVTALYTLGRKSIGKYQFIDKAGVLNDTYENMEQFQGKGLSVYLGYNPSEKTTWSVNGMLNHLNIKTEKSFSENLHELSNRGFCGSFFASFTQRFNRGWRFVCSGGCVRPEVTIGTSRTLYPFYNCYVARTFLNEKLTLALRGENFMKSSQRYTDKEAYPDFCSSDDVRQYNRSYGITISYNFGSLKAKVKKAERSIENDDIRNTKK